MLRTPFKKISRTLNLIHDPLVVISRSRSFSTSSSSSSPSPPLSAASTSTVSSNAGSRSTNTISPAEIAHFSSLSAHWWDPTGEFGLLHRMNPCRIQFMRDSLLRVEELPKSQWLQGRHVLDVGCGGGIFAESIARLGATTMAIDASGSNISVAQTHASIDPNLNLINSSIPRPESIQQSTTPPASPNSLEYRHCAAEDLVEQGEQFDIVCAMEVIEHVEDPRGFLECLMQLTKPGGHLLLSTISRTPLSKFLTITMAERVLRLVTPGTHTYSKYLKPEELREFFEEKDWLRRGGSGWEQRGCLYDPLAGKWRLLGQGEYGGWGEMGNYFAGIRKPFE